MLSENIKDKRWYICIFTIFFIMSIFLNLPKDTTLKNIDNFDIEGKVPVGLILSNDILIQKFKAQRDNLSQVDILLSTYMKSNVPGVSATLLDENKNIIKTDTFTKISDNSWHAMKFTSIPNSSGKTFELQIRGIDGIPSNAPTPWFIPVRYQGDTLTVNGIDAKKELVMKVYYNSIRNILIVSLLLGVVYLLVVIYIIRLSDCTYKNAKMFFLSIGWILILTHTFPSVFDEFFHFIKAYQVSQFNFTGIKDSMGIVYVHVPRNITNFQGWPGTGSIRLDNLLGVGINVYRPNSIFLPDILMDTTKADIYSVGGGGASTVAIPYLASAIGIIVGKILHLPAYWIIFVFGRLGNYIFYAVMVCFSIKKTPVYKNLFFVIATLPQAIFLACSYSYDPIITSSALVFISICLFYYHNKGINKIYKKDLIILLISLIFATSAKSPAYLPIFFIYFIIPKSIFKSKKNYAIITLLWLAIIISNTAYIQYLSKHLAINDSNTTGKQIQFILENPTIYSRILLKQIINNFAGCIGEISNDYFVALPIFNNISLLFLFAVSVFEKNKIVYNKENDKYLFIGYGLISISFVYCIISTILYLGDPIGANSIWGIQNRYFIPVQIFVWMIIGNLVFVKTKLIKFNEFVGFALSLFLINVCLPFLFIL